MQKAALVLGVVLLAGSFLMRSGSESRTDPETSIGSSGRPGMPMPMPTDAASQGQLDKMVVAEEVIWELAKKTEELAASVRNLRLPDSRTRPFFWPLLRVKDLDGAATPPAASEVSAALSPLQVTTRAWALGETRDLAAHEVDLWRPLFEDVSHFFHASFKIKTGHFVEASKGKVPEFETKLRFAGLARLQSGEISWVRTTQRVRWRTQSGENSTDADDWWITSWDVVDATQMDADAPLFEDVLAQAIVDPDELARARHSIHERTVADKILAKRAGQDFELPHPEFNDIANDRHPGLAIVDLDRDGWDDLYVVTRWGRAQFFHNQGDGSFVERAAELGLDIDGWSSSALFADFDNDGDADLFLGRNFKRTLYLENQDGRFVDRSTESINGPLPFFTSSVSATDYDGDGLLDAYVSTYAAMRNFPELYEGYLDPGDLKLYREARKQHAMFVDSAGPPNMLLHNEGGGRFTIVPDPGPLRAMRHTYQSTWVDFDRDGDADVYLSNDFAPDDFIRNDGGGRFTSITKEAGFVNVGLGMGSSWGDYDRDGLQDVYVSNMYSTAGTRITERLPFLDSRLAETTQGNYLYRNEAGRFEKTSSLTGPGLKVQQTGWSWGGQFGDIDNDGFLDLAVPNGFYTAPREVALSGDT